MKNNKKGITLIIIIAILAVIIGGEILGWHYFGVSDEKIEGPEEFVKNGTIDVKDEIVNWNTFKSGLWNFEIKFPSHTFKIGEYPYANPGGQWLIKFSVDGWGSPDDHPEIGIGVYELSTKSDIIPTEFINNAYCQSSDTENNFCTTIGINQVQVDTERINFYTGMVEEEITSIHTVFGSFKHSHYNRIINIWITQKSTGSIPQDDINRYNKMLSTFKLTQ